MRVVVPFTELHLATDIALQNLAPHAERIDVSAAAYPATAYWELLKRMWADGESFIVIEHDIEIHDSVLESFETCAEPWCVFPYLYRGRSLFENGLGCVRFSDRLIETTPNLFAGMRPAHWTSLDGALCNHLEKRADEFGLRPGYRPHLHWPEVRHHDEGKPLTREVFPPAGVR
jgi:hypothetical protein